MFFGFTEQTEKQPKQIEFWFVSVLTEKKFDCFEDTLVPCLQTETVSHNYQQIEVHSFIKGFQMFDVWSLSVFCKRITFLKLNTHLLFLQLTMKVRRVWAYLLHGLTFHNQLQIPSCPGLHLVPEVQKSW
jgi:hypothetical protein